MFLLRVFATFLMICSLSAQNHPCSNYMFPIEVCTDADSCEISEYLPYNDSDCRTNEPYTPSHFDNEGLINDTIPFPNATITLNGSVTFKPSSFYSTVNIDLNWFDVKTKNEEKQLKVRGVFYKELETDDTTDDSRRYYNNFIVDLIYSNTNQCFDLDKVFYVSWVDEENATVFQSALFTVNGTSSEAYIMVLYHSESNYCWSGFLNITIDGDHNNTPLKNIINFSTQINISDKNRRFIFFKNTNGKLKRLNRVCETPHPPKNVLGPVPGLFLSEATYTCYGGCKLLNYNSTFVKRTCSDNGEWFEEIPDCPDLKCDSIEDIKNGSWQISTEGGLTVSYECDIDYELAGNNTITCMCDDISSTRTVVEGIWSDSGPVCLPLNCEEPDNITNGQVSTDGRIANYSCHEKYILTDDSPMIRKCINGTWSDKEPQCLRVYCNRQLIPCNEYPETDIIPINGLYWLSGEIIEYIEVHDNGTVDINNGSKSITIAYLEPCENCSSHYVCDEKLAINYSKIQTEELECVLKNESVEDFNITDYLIVTWINYYYSPAGKVVTFQLAIVTDSTTNKTYAIFLYNGTMLGEERTGFIDRENLCHGELFYMFPRLANNSIIETGIHSVYVERIDTKLGGNCSCNTSIVDDIINTPSKSWATCNLTGKLVYKLCDNSTWTGEDFCPEPAVRLVKGNESSGLVEVCHELEWRSVCDDYWTSRDAVVVCKQLGFLPFVIKHRDRITRGRFGDDPVKYWLDDLRCKGFEPSLFDCKHGRIGYHNCRDGERAGVHCLNKSDLDIRLTSKGYIELGLRGEYRAVCGTAWSNVDARVACRELGTPNNKAIAFVARNSEKGWMDRVKCKGNEDHLFACQFIHFGGQCYWRAGVIC